MSDLIKNAGVDDFQTEVLESELPVLVDYWAEWCGPCKAFAPVLEEVAQEYEGKLKVVKVDVEAHPQAAAEYGIRGIPTIKLFKNGEVAATQSGALKKADLQAFIDQAIQ